MHRSPTSRNSSVPFNNPRCIGHRQAHRRMLCSSQYLPSPISNARLCELDEPLRAAASGRRARRACELAWFNLCCKTMLPLNSCIARPPGRTGPMPECIHCVQVTTDRSRRLRSSSQPEINTQSGTVAPSVAPVAASYGRIGGESLRSALLRRRKRAASRLQAAPGVAHRSRECARNEKGAPT